MSRYLEGRRYGYLTPETDGGFYKGIQHQQVAGCPIGIVYIENINYPIIPGNVVNGCSLVFGSLLAWGKLSGNRIAKAAASLYTLIIRCTPTVILLFLCYYGLPKLFDPLGIYIDDMNVFWYCLIAFTLLNSASLSELIRSSFAAVDKGQSEAAAMAGLTGLQTLRRITLPQALYIAAPNLGNMLIGLIKEVSLAFTIGFVDMMGKTKLLISLRYGNHAIESYLALLVIYWVLTLIITKLEKLLESRLGAGRKAAVTD